MWRLVLVVSLLCCSSEASVSCKDENGVEVDWYILYNTPKSKKNQLTGVDYVYIYPDNNNKADYRVNTKPIDATDGILAHTLRQLLDFQRITPGVMWRLVLVVSLLCCSSEASVSCKDEKGDEVDWYILYKTPKSEEKGLGYVYIYPDATDNKVKSHLITTKRINAADGILANTLRQLLDFKKKDPTPNFGFISYSDQPPDINGRVKSVPQSYGHSKGVVMMEEDKTGLWLLHSTPRFPKRGKSFWPKSGTDNAQTFICVTFNYDQFKAIGTHLQYINAFRYHEHIPPDFHVELQQPKPGEKRKIIDISNKFQELKSRNNKAFNSIAKPVSEEGKAEDGDLYITISKAVDSDVNVQTWGCQGDPSFCPESGKKVERILSVKPGSDWAEWKPGNDHSKWCVAMDHNRPWTCIADVNRAKTQYERPGGALCVYDEEIANIFRSFVTGVQNC